MNLHTDYILFTTQLEGTHREGRSRVAQALHQHASPSYTTGNHTESRPKHSHPGRLQSKSEQSRQNESDGTRTLRILRSTTNKKSPTLAQPVVLGLFVGEHHIRDRLNRLRRLDMNKTTRQRVVSPIRPEECDSTIFQMGRCKVERRHSLWGCFRKDEFGLHRCNLQ